MSRVLDLNFLAAAQWNRDYETDAQSCSESRVATIGLLRQQQAMARKSVSLLPEAEADRTFFYVERLLKSWLWAFGGNRILFDGPPALLSRLQQHYAHAGTGRFDSELVGEKICGAPITVEAAPPNEIPEPTTQQRPLGKHLDGCRIGFDLGGSDRKCAALIDGEVLFSEEVSWEPYFQSDPDYHYQGIMDSLRRAAAHLPRVDAIGGSAAGVYVENEVRVASLFRGVSPADFDAQVRGLFHRIQKEWGHVPFVVINDGEVTALAGAMSLDDNALLGVSLGTSTAAGYVTPEGHLTPWLNELAFVPVDYRLDGPVDEWSGDIGCGVQFFSQQGVARLAEQAGLQFDSAMPLAERLLAVQERMAQGDPGARSIYETIGNCFGHAIAHWTSLYDLRHLLILGRVTSGPGGALILDRARTVLHAEYPDLAERVALHTPDEQMKRHGQAVAAASLPMITPKRRNG